MIITPKWIPYEIIFFDCDSTLSTIEGIEELARAKRLFDEVKRLTDSAMEGEVQLESVYDRRLQMLRPTRGEIRRVERLYRENLVPDAREVIQALQFLRKEIFIVSGGLYEAVCPFGEWLGVPPSHIRAVEVAFDLLSGEWWDYQADQWGKRPDVTYHKHDESPLVQSIGKANVVRQLKNNRTGRSMLIGDGMSDIAAQSEVNRVIGFGGVVVRQGVVTHADIFITCNSLAPILPLTTSSQERNLLKGTSHAKLLEKGLMFIKDGHVKFKKETLHKAVLYHS